MKYIKALIRKLAWLVFSHLPIQKKKIVFISFSANGYGDNPKYIAEELLKSSTKFKLIWLVKGKKEAESVPNGIKAVRFQSLASFFHIATAKVWVNNCRKFYYSKRRKQYYINTWHGFALKQIEKDTAQTLGEAYVNMAIADSKVTNLYLSDSHFMTGIYQNSFWYSGEVAEFGAPRNDIILNQEDDKIRKKVLSAFSLSDDKKVILYAPTFRADLSLDCYSLDYDRLKAICEKRFGASCIILVRLHPKITAKAPDVCKYTNTVLNASPYPDMQELLAAADIVITDYSSLMFDFALSLKPCFQFATDIEDYKADRNFYFDIESLPFPLAVSNEELEKNIETFDEDAYKKDVEAFFDKVGMIRDGQASKKCVERIISVCQK